MTQAKIRVLLADDHAIVRDGLSALLAEDEHLEVVGQTSDGLETIHTALDLEPDVIVMDIAMPRINGIEATRRILRANPNIRILVLSQYEHAEHVMDALCAGASGYLLKRDSGAELVEGIRAVHEWGAVLHPLAARTLLDAYRQAAPNRTTDCYEQLTEREREILILVAEGFTNQQIAQLLHISPRTVDGHRTSLMAKLDLHDRTDVVKYALRRQLIDL